MRFAGDVERLSTRPVRMDDSINPFEHRDVDCSGRSLATLLVAWVGAAMVASVLLRWKYMWIALTILTLLFLFACGYAACNARRAQERIIVSEEENILERRRRVPEPPAYQAYWITDLPPPYAAVTGAEPHPVIPRSGLFTESEPTSSTDRPRLSNPPPYSVAIQSEANTLQMNSSQTSRVGTSSLERPHPIIDEPTNSGRERVLVSTLAWNEDKNANEQSSNAGTNSQTVRSSGTQYLSNIISCTFGIGQRRNAERNSTAHTITRDRPDIFQLSTTTQVSATSDNRINASTL